MNAVPREGDSAGDWTSRDAHITSAAQLACLLEATAPKPGNVSPGRHFSDARYEDFLASAAAIGPVLTGVGERPLGPTIRRAVEATSAWTRSNTNLGMVLLLVPLASAASTIDSAQQSAVRSSLSIGAEVLRQTLRTILSTTTVQDARQVYAAIRLAGPGGLGRAETQDLTDEPTVTLLDAMRLAANRDGIAYEYATAYEVTFEHAAPALVSALSDGLSWDDAVVEVFLALLAARPDSHIARRAGQDEADAVSRLAAAALEAGGVRSPAGRRTIDDMDRVLRQRANTTNPGTTADLTAAAIFVVLLGGGWRRDLATSVAARQG